MSLLSTLTSDASIADEKDSIGTGGPLESGLYKGTVSTAHISKSAGGALGLNLSIKTDTGKEVRQTLWMTSGTAKGCKNYYEKDGQKNYLPGFIAANALALLTVGKEISQLDTEEKVIKAYNREAGAEMPTKVDMVVDLLGKEILMGIIKQTVDKTKKNEATGAYEPTGETREENEVDKFFRASDRKTTMEIRMQMDATFADQWDTKWAGKTKDKTSKVSGTSGAPKSGFPGISANSPMVKKPTSSLFA